LLLRVSGDNPEPLYQQIINEIRRLILTGELSPGDPLPSVRELAQKLTTSVITTRRAYLELEREGWLTPRQGLAIFPLYLLGIVLAIVMGRLFKAYLFRGETSHFVMELPPYRLPTLRGILIHMWERGSAFVRKAGTVIVGVVVLVWALSSLPWGVEYASEGSLLGRLGNLVAPVLAPAGFATWEAAAALMFGLLAKEVVVGTLGVVYGTGEEGLADAVRVHFTPLSAYPFLACS